MYRAMLFYIFIVFLTGGPCLTSKARKAFHEQVFPTTVIIGVKKCGTRALITMLGTHPDVTHLTFEAHYFDYDQQYDIGDDW